MYPQILLTRPIFKQLIERWHYLRYKVPFGAHARYLVESEKLPGRYLACLQFSSPAWKMAPRDAWSGWSAEERKRNLQFIVANSRFLIPSYVSVRGLASTILSLAAQHLPKTGNDCTDIALCCLRLWSNACVLEAPLTKQPTGFIWAARRAAVAWIATMCLLANP
ncbi:MAG: DUF4338 domain-containing protein [Acidobacteria bacterium]|nr:DUF4338 domain-containing protein [Acidobacteriota bacterium]